jgi:peptidoglycan hydrolase-like protein with peptidoglycan-binding domain
MSRWDLSGSGSSFFTEVGRDDLAVHHSPADGRLLRVIRRLVILVLLPVATSVLIVATGGITTAGADPSSSQWNRLRGCESSGDYATNTGNGYYGAYQFNLSTWRSVGGRGYPNQASPAEQDRRALILYRMRGWQPWTCAGILGLRADSNAGSGRINDISIPAAPATSTPAPAAPAAPSPAHSAVPRWPGTQYFSLGDHSAAIARWQTQMHIRGSLLVGAGGDFGSNTLAVVRRIQGQNSLPQTGILGPVTWRLAWIGTYHDAVSRPSAPAPKTAPASGTARAGSAPDWPGPQYFSLGDHGLTIARWQAQLHTRGSFLRGTGDFGPNTLAAVKRIQGENGLPQTGILGPVTWALAWTGNF